MAANGREGVEAVRTALEAGERYDLVCLDIMMPEMDGLEALRQMRLLEESNGIGALNRAKIIMTTGVANRENVPRAHEMHCNCSLSKPFRKEKLQQKLRKLGLRKNVATSIWELGEPRLQRS